MPTNVDLEALSIQELEEYIQGLDQDQGAIRDRRVAAHSVLDQKNMKAEAERRLENLSVEQQEILQEVLQAKLADEG